MHWFGTLSLYLSLSILLGCAEERLRLLDVYVPPGFDTAAPTDADDDRPQGPMTVRILDPAADAVFPPDSTIDLVCDIEHETGDVRALRVTWTSDRSGTIGQGRPDATGRVVVTRVALPNGPHRLRATAYDDGTGTLAYDEVEVLVRSRPTAPAIRIEPMAPTSRDDLTVVIVRESDADPGADVTYHYRWRRNDGLAPGQDRDTVAHTVTAKHDVWEVTVTPSVEGYEGQVATAAVTILNSPPALSDVQLLPTLATTSDDLQCRPGGVADPDGDEVTLTFAWRKNELYLELPSDQNDLLPAEHFRRGDRLECEVTPTDDEGRGEPVRSPTLTIANSPPRLGSVTMTPMDGNATTAFTCAAHDPEDDDGDEVAVRWRWFLDGAQVEGAEQASFVPFGARRGQQLQCAGVPTDGFGDGTLYRGPSRALGNTPPTLETVLVAPGTASLRDTLTCTPTDGADADGDPLTYTFRWFANGVALEGEEREVLTPRGVVTKGTTISCEATPSDGFDTGTPATSKNSARIVNSPPSISGAVITPSAGGVDTPFRCASVGWDDPDLEDPRTPFFAWLRNGALVEGVIGEAYTGPLAPRDLLACEVRPYDGEAYGATLRSTSVRIIDEPPTLESVTLLPERPRTDTTLQCIPEGYFDPEGAPPQYTFHWLVNGEPVDAALFDELPGEYFRKGDVVLCRVTPNDGVQDGQPVYSPPVTIVNTPPRIVVLELTPGSGNHHTVFRCEPRVVDDPDEDVLTFTFGWRQRGASVPGAHSNILANFPFESGDEIQCTATPSDGIDTGPMAESNRAVVFNSLPTIEWVEVTPSPARADEDLKCVPRGYFDADGDPPHYRFLWLKNGFPMGGLGEDGVLPAGHVRKHDQVVCQVTPNDGIADGAPRNSAPVSIENSPPTVAWAAVRGFPLEDDLGESLYFRCHPREPSDLDGDTVSFGYRWLRNGAFIPEVTADEIAAVEFGPTDTVQCEVTPFDGEDHGESVLSNVLNMANTPPTALIVKPTEGDVGARTYLRFEGLVSDLEDRPEELEITWTSSRDGVLHTGAPNAAGVTRFATNQLSLGFHVITLRVRDSFLAVAEDEIFFNVATRCGDTGYDLGDTGHFWTDGFETGDLSAWDFANYFFIGASPFPYRMASCDNTSKYLVDPGAARSGLLGLLMEMPSNFFSVAKRFGSTPIASVYVECMVFCLDRVSVQFGLFIDGTTADGDGYPIHYSGGTMLLTSSTNFTWIPPGPDGTGLFSRTNAHQLNSGQWVRLAILRDVEQGTFSFYEDDREVVTVEMSDGRSPSGFSIGVNSGAGLINAMLLDDCMYYISQPVQ